MINEKIATKLLFIFIASLFSLQLETKMFVGAVVFPVSVYPSLCLYYKGQKLLLDACGDQEYKNISFSVNESPGVQEINILICQEPACFAQDNNIKHLTVCSPAAYKLYALKGMRYFNEEGKEELSWNIIEKELDKNVVPNNTLIFVFDPSLVEGLQVQPWSKEDQMRILPKIVMKKNTSRELFAQAMNIARMSAMDLDPYHEKATSRSMQTVQAVVKLSNKVR